MMMKSFQLYDASSSYYKPNLRSCHVQNHSVPHVVTTVRLHIYLLQEISNQPLESAVPHWFGWLVVRLACWLVACNALKRHLRSFTQQFHVYTFSDIEPDCRMRKAARGGAKRDVASAPTGEESDGRGRAAYPHSATPRIVPPYCLAVRCGGFAMIGWPPGGLVGMA